MIPNILAGLASLVTFVFVFSLMRRGVLRDVVLLEKASRFSVLPTGFGSTQGTSGGRSA